MMQQYLKKIIRVDDEIQGCIILSQFKSKLPFAPKEDFFRKLTDVSFVKLLYPILLQCFKNKSLEPIIRYNLVQHESNWVQIACLLQKRNFLVNLNNANFMHL